MEEEKKSKEAIKLFDWERMFLSDELPFTYLLEVAFRTSIMYLAVLTVLKITGKRSIMQLTFFELTIVVSLGSAAGDPMFYHDVPMLPALLVLFTVGGLYKLITYLSTRHEKVEKALEGKSERILHDNMLNYEVLETQNIPNDEVFMIMREKHVSHLGQVKLAYLEVSGNVSIFFAETDETVPGLPIFPDVLKKAANHISAPGLYSCTRCGLTISRETGDESPCNNCEHTLFVQASDAKRIT